MGDGKLFCHHHDIHHSPLHQEGDHLHCHPQNSIANTPVGHFDYYFDCHHHDHRGHTDDHKLICHRFDDHDHCYNPDELNHFQRGGKELHDDDHLHCHHHVDHLHCYNHDHSHHHDDHQRQHEVIYPRNVVIHHDHGHHDHHGDHH